MDWGFLLLLPIGIYFIYMGVYGIINKKMHHLDFFDQLEDASDEYIRGKGAILLGIMEFALGAYSAGGCIYRLLYGF